MERERLVELLGSVRGVREPVFRMEEAMLEALSEERASDFLGDEHERGSDERFELAELDDWLKIIRTAARRRRWGRAQGGARRTARIGTMVLQGAVTVALP